MDPQKPRQYDYSFALTATSSGAFGIGSNLSWDAYQREIYNQLNTALQKQAELLLKRGNPSAAEISALVDQRNLILAETRSNLSPFGELYSELLKPSNDLPTLEKLLAQKGSLEAVLESVGRTRAVVNRLSVTMKVAGRGAVALQVVVSVVLIAMAPPKQRGQVAAGQVGAVIGGSGLGWGGAWAGCATASMLVSPTLVIPIVGEVSEGTACLAGGIIGGFGFGMLGGSVGQYASEKAYVYVTSLRWTKP